MSKDEYNKVPIFYCKSCLGLHVINDEDGSGSYCRDCGSTSIGRIDFELWQEYYRLKYGHDFLESSNEKYEYSEYKD